MSVLPNLEQLPAAIVESVRGVVMKLEWRDGKETKVPYQAHCPSHRAAVDNPATWRPFMEVYDAVADGKADAAGIILGGDLHLNGVDVDRCRNRETGEITPAALAVIEALDSYTEISFSGTGVHVLAYGELPPGGRRRNGIELYSELRYFVVTGAHLPGTPTVIHERTAQLQALYAQVSRPAPSSPPRPVSTMSTTLDDAALLTKASTATNGTTFTALWSGDIAGYGDDESAADLGLCNLLAFWTRCDPDQMDRLFRQSGLMRDKWDSRRRETTYGAITIAKAIGDCAEVYEPAVTIVLDDGPIENASAPTPSGDGWPTLSSDARIGLFGELLDLVETQTEAAPVAILGHALLMWGNLVGRSPHAMVGADVHHLNDNVLIVGDTSSGRKGMALGEARAVMALVDPDWAVTRVLTGLSSGEGLIYHVRDAVVVQEPVQVGRQTIGQESVVTDEGIADKRLTIIEPEFAKTLRVSRRDGNTLSATLRQAWDTGDLRVLTRSNPLIATAAHLTTIGHITPREFRQELKTTDMASGFINRFLILLARRSRYLPNGGVVDSRDRQALVDRFQVATHAARTRARLTRDAGADAYWAEVYPWVTRDRPGLVGDVCTRAPAHVLRISLLYALADRAPAIQLHHLKAALAIWNYAEASARIIFSARVGHRLSDFLLVLLRANPMGLTRTEISDALGRHRRADEIHEALQLLVDFGVAHVVKEPTGTSGGRPVHRWFAVDGDAK